MIMSNDNQQRRTCGNCQYCRRRAPHGGVQLVAANAPQHVCFGMPPSPGLLSNGAIVTLRPPVNENDPGCSRWRLLSEE